MIRFNHKSCAFIPHSYGHFIYPNYSGWLALESLWEHFHINTRINAYNHRQITLYPFTNIAILASQYYPCCWCCCCYGWSVLSKHIKRSNLIPLHSPYSLYH